MACNALEGLPCICMVSDFFLPQLGGVEVHIWSLSEALVRAGHRVVVVTHAYPGYRGVRYFANGVKAYYLPIEPFVGSVTFPTIFAFMPLLRDIWVREGVDIVHGHTSASNLAAEAVLQAQSMGLRTCFTEHSLFRLGTPDGINLTKAFRFAACSLDHAFCVSRACRANFVRRVRCPPRIVSVVPNAIEPARFTPDPARRGDGVVVVVVGRLVARKGTALLAEVIPAVCAARADVSFVVAGDGDMRVAVEEAIEAHALQNRVALLGAVPHSGVRDVLVRGHVFLNCSLTEAFCITILEAASCGLRVVSTDVGGVPEVLPRDLISCVPPDARSLTDAVLGAAAARGGADPFAIHRRVEGLYSWQRTAECVAAVYADLHARGRSSLDVVDRAARHRLAGPILGLLSFAILSVVHAALALCRLARPDAAIEPAPDWSAACRRHRASALQAPPAPGGA